MSGIIYLLLFSAIVLTVVGYNQSKPDELATVIKKPFAEKWANKLYSLSYTVPFVWFIDTEEKSSQAIGIKEKIAEANIGDKFNYRSFTVLKVGVVMLSFILFAFISLLLDNAEFVMGLLFNFAEGEGVGNSVSSMQNIKIITFMLLLATCLLPNIILKKRAMDYKFYYLKDIPIIQLFLILMLKSKKPLNEVLFSLAKINTRYKGVFETGYRIYLRNKQEGLKYIEESFGETKFKETIKALKDYGEYSRDDTIKLLENNMEQIVDYNNSTNRRKDLSKLVYSQATIAIPFVSIIVLCLVPLAVYGLQIFETSGMMGFS